MRNVLLFLTFLFFNFSLATDYNAIQTSINLIIEFSKELQDVPNPSECTPKEAQGVPYFIQTLMTPIRNSKAQIQAFNGVLQSKDAVTVLTSVSRIESDFAKGMPDIVKLKQVIISAKAGENMEYYMYYLNEAVHGFGKSLPKILPNPQQAKAKTICSKLQAETVSACTAFYNNCTQYVI